MNIPELLIKIDRCSNGLAAEIYSLQGQVKAAHRIALEGNPLFTALRCERDALEAQLEAAKEANVSAAGAATILESRLREAEAVLRYIYYSTAEDGQWEESGVHNLVKAVLAPGRTNDFAEGK